MAWIANFNFYFLSLAQVILMAGRPQYSYLVFDFPSDHEIDGAIVTESDAIRSVLANKSLGGRLKLIRCTTASTFKTLKAREYPGIRFVHLGCHGSER